MLTVFISLFPLLAPGQTTDRPCYTDMQALSPAVRQLMQTLPADTMRSRARLAATDRLECRVAVDVDNALFRQYDGNADQIRHEVYQAFGRVSAIFEREINVRLVVTQIRIWEGADPYPTTGPDIRLDHLYALNNWWSNNRRGSYDVVVGYSTSFVGGQAFLGGPQMASAGVVGVQPHAFSVALTAHELGHSFGSAHTHDCGWPGGPIDRCATLEGNCAPGTERNEWQTEVGTLMSYCQRVLSFHPLCREVMRRVAENSGLTPALTVPDVPVVSRALAGPNRPDLYLVWSPVLRATSYRVQVGTDSSFSQPLIDSTMALPIYQLAQPVDANRVYYWRTCGINTPAGAGGWSAVGRFQLSVPAGLSPLLIRRPDYGNLNETTGLLSWYPATSPVGLYEVQLAESGNLASLSNALLLRTSTPFLSIDVPDVLLSRIDADVYWRVRVGTAQGVGPWSAVSWFRRAPKARVVWPLNQRDYTGSIPLAWPIGQAAPLTSTVELSTTTAYDKNVRRKTLVQNEAGGPIAGLGITVFDSLIDNQTYYYRIRQTSPDGTGPYTYGSFTTGSERTAWQHLNAGNSPLPASGLRQVLPQPDGSLWVAATWGLYNRLADGRTWRTYTTKTTGGQLTGAVSAMAVDRAGVVWAATTRSLFRFDGSSWQRIPVPVASLLLVIGLEVDTAGAVYVLTAGQGVLRYRDGQWTQFGAETLDPYLYAGTLDSRNGLWVSNSAGVARFDGRSWTLLNKSTAGLPFDYVTRLSVDTSATRLAVANGLELALRDGSGNWRRWAVADIDPTSRQTGATIAGMAFDRQNRLTVLTQHNLFRLEEQGWVASADPMRTEPGQSPVMSIGPDNRVWLITDNSTLPGLSVYDARSVRLSAASRARYCPGDTVALRLSVDAGIRPGTPLTAQLTGPGGTYDVPVRFAGDSVYAALPAGLTLAGSYRLRLLMPTLGTSGWASPYVQVLAGPRVQLTGPSNGSVCADQPLSLSATVSGGTSYQWLRNGSPLTDARQPVFTPNQSGQYALAVTSEQGCTTTSTAVNLTVAAPLTVTVAPTAPAPVYIPDAVELTASGSLLTGYQWYREGVRIDGATAAAYRAAQSGQYTVGVTGPTGCTALSAPVSVQVLIPVATESEADLHLGVRPNPSSGAVVVRFRLAQRTDVTVRLTDAAGRQVRLVVWTGLAAGPQERTLDNLPTSGFYVLSLTAGNQQARHALIRQ
ncbi:hypothetical protein GCM10027578_08100 [Spirosoma luteolum]